jgi:hypothetical protein
MKLLMLTALLTQAAYRAHLSIVGSPDDPEWARRMESQLTDFLARQPEAKALKFAPVVCRSAGCEIQATVRSGAGPSVPSRNISDWGVLLRRMRAEKWFADFEQDLPNFYLPDGKDPLHLTILPRARKATFR